MAVSFASQIKPLFRPKDLGCMSGQGVELGDYAYMSDPSGDEDHPDHAHARRVLDFLKPGGLTPRMPMGGPYWTAEQLSLYECWMADGFAA